MKFLIRGGKKLKGSVEVMGAKNSVLKAMAASLLFASPVTIENVPQIEDVARMSELLMDLGAAIKRSDERTLSIDCGNVKGTDLKKEIANRLRASIVLAGPLLARSGRVSFPHPGGCVIGRRPIDVFLDGWKAMGAKIKERKSGFDVSAKKPQGTDYFFRVVSVTGTETLMMTAALAHGKTVLRNAACEPEIPALAEFLNASGAKIKGAGTNTVEIMGTGGKLLNANHSFKVIPDRIEAGSFLILGAALGSPVKVTRCNPEHMLSLISSLRDAGVEVKIGHDWVSASRPRKILPVDVKTKEYPGFPTDLQAPFAVFLTQAEGESMVFETIFEGRLAYAENLARMGANIILCDPNRIMVKGPTRLHGKEIESPDLRAGLAFIVAALIAEGDSIIRNIYQIDRGYENIDERLRKLGADIERVE